LRSKLRTTQTSLFGQKGLTWRPSRRSRASLARTSVRGPTRAHVSYAFETAVVTGKFPIHCHNPLNVGFSETYARFPQLVKALSQLRTYIVNNRHVIPNY